VRPAALVLAIFILGVVAVTAATAGTPPPGATALCRDGTYSYSKHRSGTCSGHGGVKKWLTGSSGGGSSSTKSVQTGRIVLFGRRSRTSGCTRSALPDRRCSPGGYYSPLTKPVICNPSFHTGAIRDVPQSEKFAVEREYSKPATYYGYTVEIDHIVPLELGGSNSIANLFFEPGRGKNNYHAKDQVEDRAKAWVCEGRISLAAARRGFATNWEVLYRRLFGHAPSS
jgi:Protein of unknown function (DUF3761)